MAKANERSLVVEAKIKENDKNQADKVEKMLVKNMLIGYIMAPNTGDKQQILKLLSAVLDLNQEELVKIGVVKQSGWLGGILGSPGMKFCVFTRKNPSLKIFFNLKPRSKWSL